MSGAMPGTVTATTAPTTRSIAITTPTNPGAAQHMARLEGRSLRSARAGRAILLLITSALGLALLGLAMPRTVAAWMSIEAQPALDALQNGKRPSDAELARGVTALQ